eukprot:6204364-Pleurochrysis_carterae.AAC.1
MRTQRAAFRNSRVGQLMARQSMPTANATSGRVCVEQYSRAPTKIPTRKCATCEIRVGRRRHDAGFVYGNVDV